MYGRSDYDRTQAYNQNIEQQLASQSKKQPHRRIVDHGNNMGVWYLKRSMGIFSQAIGEIRPESSYLLNLLPSPAYANINQQRNNLSILDAQSKFVHLSSNKEKHTINTVKWTPEGRRLLVASHSGEFTLWNGMTFNFETITQAHDSPILSLKYSHNDNWLLSGDQDGVVKYWQTNFNNVNIINCHSDGIRDISFSPNDSKFLTSSDDSTLKIFNFNNGKEERQFTGHHWDVKSSDWHPNLGLIVSGSRDNLIKLWDPRSGNCITTLHGFKNTVTKTRFQPNGMQRLLASVARDRSCRIFDLRTMKDLLVLRNHESDLSCVEWHPLHSSFFTVGAYDGSISHYVLDSYIPEDTKESVDEVQPIHKIPFAHEKSINALEYHPLGHLLCSAGTDRSARFWSRSRPNDPMSYQDALYTNDKNGAWYYQANNNVNAVIAPPKEFKPTSHINSNNSVPGLSIPGLNFS